MSTPLVLFFISVVRRRGIRAPRRRSRMVGSQRGAAQGPSGGCGSETGPSGPGRVASRAARPAPERRRRSAEGAPARHQRRHAVHSTG